MTYNENIGIAYDIINFGILTFCKDVLIEKFKRYEYNLEDAFIYFDEVRNKYNSPLPDCLLPFFYMETDKICFLSKYFTDVINFHSHTIEDFIEFCKSKDVKNKLFDYLFDNVSQDERKKAVDTLDSKIINMIFTNKSWSYEMKTNTMFLLYNYEFVLNQLTDTLTKLIRYVKKLHQDYKSRIKSSFKDFQSKENMLLFEKINTIKEDKINNQIISFCFFNQFVILAKHDFFHENVFILGLRYKECMARLNNEKNFSLEDAWSAIGNPIALSIINCLYENNELTSSEISRLTNVSTSTAARYVDKLFDEKFLEISKQDGCRIYFKINSKFIIIFKKAIDNFFDKISQ